MCAPISLILALELNASLIKLAMDSGHPRDEELPLTLSLKISTVPPKFVVITKQPEAYASKMDIGCPSRWKDGKQNISASKSNLLLRSPETDPWYEIREFPLILFKNSSSVNLFSNGPAKLILIKLCSFS